MSFEKFRHLQSILETEVEGYLRVAKRLGSTKRRYFRLSGAVLYEYPNGEGHLEDLEPREGVVSAVLNSNGIKREITFVVANRKKCITVVAQNDDDYKLWKTALTEASKRDIYNKYKVGRQLGRGSYGDVFYGEHRQTGLPVAVKRIAKKSNNRYLEREVNVAKSIHHANVVKTYDIFETAEYLYIVLEYMGGGELYEVLAESGTLSEKLASHVIRSILQALAYLHRHGIVHRDLKPENILCKSRDPNKLAVKVADFGLAGLMVTAKQVQTPNVDDEVTSPKSSPSPNRRLLSEHFRSILSPRRPLGRPSDFTDRALEIPNPREVFNIDDWHDYDLYAAAENELLGTVQTMTSYVGSPAFCAPEVLRKNKYGPPIDSWGVGVILFNILTGKLPFQGRNAKETVKLVKTAKFQMPDEDWKEISKEAKSLVKSLLQEDPLKRLSAEAALHHPWLETNSDHPLQHDVSMLRSRRGAIKRTMRGVIATSRMKALSLQPPERGALPQSRKSMSLKDQRLRADISKYMGDLERYRSR